MLTFSRSQSTAFAEFFTPWLVPYEHFIPVRPDLADLPAKIEWARANDGEVRLRLLSFPLTLFSDRCVHFISFSSFCAYIRLSALVLDNSDRTQHNTTGPPHPRIRACLRRARPHRRAERLLLVRRTARVGRALGRGVVYGVSVSP
jgi:hypothetical protein